MPPERSEESYEPVLRLDYDMKAPGFFSYVRRAIRGKVSNFENQVSSKILDESSKGFLIREVRAVSNAFETAVSSGETLADRKRQSEILTSAVAEFNRSMKGLDARLHKEVRSQAFGNPAFPKRPSDDDIRLRSADASRFLEESGM